MSRIGRAPIQIPNGVNVEINTNVIKVVGPKGELTLKLQGGVKAHLEEQKIVFTTSSTERWAKAYWGLYRALAANMVAGVTQGFRKDLEIVGVGYRASKRGEDIVLSVGYSHPIEFKAPEGIILNVEDSTKISVTGIDKELVGKVAAKIRDIRKPEPYKGKGIKYAGEVVRRKAGKAGVKAAA